MKTETESNPEAKAFDAKYLHNFGDLDPIPVGAMALCGAKSISNRPVVIDPPRSECCPICLALIEQEIL